MFFLRDSSLKFWENTSQIHSVPCAFGWPSSNIFPKKFHSTTFNGGIGSLSIQINGNYGWSRNKNALMPRFQLRWLYFFWTSPKVQTYPRIPAQLDLLVCWGEIQECVQSLLPTSAGLVSHLLCDTLAITSSPLAPLHTGLWFGSVLLTTLLTKQCS